jgi:hypothetical protein
LLVVGGTVLLAWDLGLRKRLFMLKARIRRALTAKSRPSPVDDATAEGEELSVRGDNARTSAGPLPSSAVQEETISIQSAPPAAQSTTSANEVTHPLGQRSYPITLKAGLLIVIGFLASVIAIATVRGTLHFPPVNFKLFSNMYLAGRELLKSFFAMKAHHTCQEL